jgi:fatty-acyl-CoA synthase
VNATLIEAVKWWARERRDQPAIVSTSDSITHGELDSWADAVCDWFVGRGLRPGDRVSIVATNSIEWCIAAYGAMRAGGLVAPINPRFTVSEISYIVGRYEPKFILFDEARRNNVTAAAQKAHGIDVESLGTVADLRRRAPANPRPPVDINADSPVVIIATSGSTGYPKGVVYSHRGMLANFTDWQLAEPYAAMQPRVQVFAPLCTSAGYVVATQMLVYGGTIFLEDAFDAEKALRRASEEKMTIFMGAPVFFERMAACECFKTIDLSSIRLAQSGGARVSRKLLDAWMEKGVVLRQMYGQTEAGGNATLNSIAESKLYPEKCGRGMPFTRIATVDKNGNFCPPNVPGEILIKGPGIMVGYWNDPEATARTLVNGWLFTGDLGVLDENGLLTMLDRIKDIIISGGLNISAAEVERVVAEFPGVEEVAVIAARDDRFGETPLAVIYAPNGLDVQALVAHCAQHLSDYKCIRYVAVHSEPLPRAASGTKISKPDLRKQYAEAHLTLPRVR